MDKDTIMALGEKPLLEIVEKNFNIKLSGLRDDKHLSVAWGIIDILVEKGWVFDMRRELNMNSVDGFKFKNGPGTIFAQHGHRPNFGSMCEGICKTCLIALALTEGVSAA
jgi:hypothetical protein